MGDVRLQVRSCRDCTSYEERRDIDGVVLCAKNIGPYICCEEFEPCEEASNSSRLYHRFCVGCVSFQDVDGVPMCAKKRNPRIACEEFEDRFEILKATRQNNHMKAVLLIQAANGLSDPEPIPSYLVEIGRKIGW